jgi:hypothetical protein
LFPNFFFSSKSFFQICTEEKEEVGNKELTERKRRRIGSLGCVSETHVSLPPTIFVRQPFFQSSIFLSLPLRSRVARFFAVQ